jgi:hypothetical protein
LKKGKKRGKVGGIEEAEYSTTNIKSSNVRARERERERERERIDKLIVCLANRVCLVIEL